MATITVKSARKDGRVAFFERDAAHPNGEVFVRGDQQAVKAGDTHALRRAIRQGNLVEVTTQAAPVNRTQTPNPRTQGDKTTNDDGQKTPGNPLGANTGGLDGLGLSLEQQKVLTDAGYGDREKLAAASDDSLIALPTIGKATVENVRKALAAK